VARYALSRRQLLRLAALLPAGAIIAACSGGGDDEEPEANEERRVDSAGIAVAADEPDATATAHPTATPTATPEPFVLPAGEEERVLMGGTPYETPYYVYGSGVMGPIVTVLGGVHGNEPGGWLAAERLVQQVRPNAGGLLIVPQANRQAVALFERTTDDLGDLNRLYPGDRDGLPMAQMAYEIVQTLKDFHVSHVIDMHESWAFYRDRTDTQTGTAFLGQTLSSRGEPGASLAMQVVETINTTRVQASHEELTFREWPPRDGFGSAPPGATPEATPTPGGPADGTAGSGFTGYRGSRSSLGLPQHIPGITAILVEMGQQQALERRIQLHVDVVQEALKILRA
jgi:hypothetical protein